MDCNATATVVLLLRPVLIRLLLLCFYGTDVDIDSVVQLIGNTGKNRMHWGVAEHVFLHHKTQPKV